MINKGKTYAKITIDNKWIREKSRLCVWLTSWFPCGVVWTFLLDSLFFHGISLVLSIGFPLVLLGSLPLGLWLTSRRQTKSNGNVLPSLVILSPLSPWLSVCSFGDDFSILMTFFEIYFLLCKLYTSLFVSWYKWSFYSNDESFIPILLSLSPSSSLISNFSPTSESSQQHTFDDYAPRFIALIYCMYLFVGCINSLK